jgi:hypothetical protein
MTQTIWKFTIPFGDTADVEMPMDAKILTAQMQHGHLRIWAMVDPRRDTVLRRINIAGTGHDLSSRLMGEYIASFQLEGGMLIFHVFDGGIV